MTFLDTAGHPTLNKEGYAAIQYQYDENQYPIRLTYLDEKYNRTYISSGYSAILRSVDKNGNILTETYLDLNDNPVASASGFATERNTWDERKRLIRREYLDEGGQPVIINTSYSAVSYQYDNRDNKIRESYYNTYGELTWCNYGYSEITLVYDNRNHCIEEHLLTSQGKPAIHSKNLYSWLKREVDPDGKMLSIKYYDTAGLPTFFAGEFSEARFTYDLAGRQTSVSYFDKAGNPCLCLRGYSKKTTAYNAIGNVTEEAYYDTEYNLTDTKMKYAKVVYTYDNLGNMTSERYYDTKELGVIPEDARYAQILNEWDDKGRLISEEYYDEYDNLALNRDGYAAHMISYTDSGLIQEEFYLDDDEKPIAIAEGYSRRTLISEDQTNGTYVMNVLNETATDEDPYAKIIQTYDRYGRAIESDYFRRDGSPAIGPEGSPIVTREFTSRGDISLIRYYDENRNSYQVNGTFGMRKDYNAYANLERESWLDEDGTPMLNNDGYASIWYDYDLSDSANVEKKYQYYYDAAGEPIAAKNGAWGVYYLYYPITLIHNEIYIDQNKNPVMIDKQYAILKYQLDENGNRIWEWYYDESNIPTNCADGYFSVERQYDNEGRLISERYVDRYNKLTNNTDGVAGWNGYYDEDGKLVITNRYDKDLNQISEHQEGEK